MILAIIQFSIICVAYLNNWLWLAAGMVIWFSVRHWSFPLVPLAIVFDGYFGQFMAVPWLSFLAIVWYLFIEELKPYLRQKQQEI